MALFDLLRAEPTFVLIVPRPGRIELYTMFNNTVQNIRAIHSMSSQKMYQNNYYFSVFLKNFLIHILIIFIVLKFGFLNLFLRHQLQDH